jgi:Ca-activated chloride channel homolog
MRPIACVGVICALSTAPALADRLVTSQRGKLVDVAAERSTVTVQVSGDVARTRVDQRFAPPRSARDAVYVATLPASAHVRELALELVAPGAVRAIRGTLRARNEIVIAPQAARDPALAALLARTRTDPRFVAEPIAHLAPDSTITATLDYVQHLRPHGAAGHELVIPARLASADPRIEIDAGVPIARVTSPSHRIVTTLAAPGSSTRATVRIEPATPPRELVLRISAATVHSPSFGVIGHRDATGGHFLFVAHPPQQPATVQLTPRELVFVLDTSASMRGAPLAKAKELIRRVLWTLRPDETFQLVRLSDTQSRLGSAPIAAKPRNIELALRWLAAVEAGDARGHTGLGAALALPADPRRLRIVAWIGDGFTGDDDVLRAQLRAHAATTRLFAFAIGATVHEELLAELAAIGRGTVHVVRPDDHPTAAVLAFEQAIAAPALVDLRVDWNDLAVTDLAAPALPDLFVGRPIVLAGRYTRGGRGTITVHGTQAGRRVRFDVPVELPTAPIDRPEIAAVWAREQIAERTRAHVLGARGARASELEREITALSLAHRVPSRFTTFAAVPADAAATRPVRVVVPVVAPRITRDVAGDPTIAATPVAVPQITFSGPPLRRGQLDGTIVRRYIRLKLPGVRHCYELALRLAPALAGQVVSELDIAPNGVVAMVRVSGIGDRTLHACIERELREIRFPEVRDGDPVRVTYPFTFRRSH